MTLVYWYSDHDPTFQIYNTADTALNIIQITHSQQTRIMQCLTLPDDDHLTGEGQPESRTNGGETEEHEGGNTPEPVERDTGSGDGGLSTIHEDEEEHEMDEYITETFYQELMSEDKLEEHVADLHDELVPVFMTYEDHVLMTGDDDNTEEPVHIFHSVDDVVDEVSLEEDEYGQYVELCFPGDMAKVVIDEDQLDQLKPGYEATVRVYASEKAKRAVVIKEDDLLTKKDIQENATEVSSATVTELKTWIDNKCFKKCSLKDARNVMTSRYVVKWKFAKQPDGSMKKTIRMRMCLRGFMDIEAFSVDTFSGTARRTSQRFLASEAACHKDWILASLDIDKAFLKGVTYKELAAATGERERVVCFTLPPGSAKLLRSFPGFEDYDEAKHCLQCLKPGTGTKDAPRAFSLKLRDTTRRIGLKPTSYDPEFEIDPQLCAAKHVDDINMAGKEQKIDDYVKRVEQVFGKCKLNKHTFTNCGIRYLKDKDGSVIMDQDDYIKTLRPIVHPELTGAAADAKVTKHIADMFVSLRGALAYATLTQAWIQVYVVALQRVQEPTNLDVRRLNAATRKLQSAPKKMVFPAMK